MQKTARDELSQIKLQLTSLKAQVEDQKTLVSNLRQANKTLREELRKVQSSVQLMERSRNPGVGYWSSAHQHAQSGANSSTGGPRSGSVSGEVTPGTEPRRSLESVRTDATRRTGAAEGTPNSNASPAANEEEEVNLEVSLLGPLMRWADVTVSAKCHFTVPRAPSYAETARSGAFSHSALYTSRASTAQCKGDGVAVYCRVEYLHACMIVADC